MLFLTLYMLLIDSTFRKLIDVAFDKERNHVIVSTCLDLVTVFDAILTSRQTREKLQYLCKNQMSNNFRRTAVLKKKMICKLNLHSQGFYWKKLRALHALEDLEPLF